MTDDDTYEEAPEDHPNADTWSPHAPGPREWVTLAALAAAEDGYTSAPGDAALPAAVREVVERAAADDGRDLSQYWVKYRPAPDPFGEGDGYEVMAIPAIVVAMPGAVTVEVSLDAEAFNDGLARASAQFAQITEALGGMADAAALAFRPLAEALHGLFGDLVYLTDGMGPGPVTDADSALAWLAYAETVTVLRRVPKPMRRRAKARYLEVKRHLGREHRARLARSRVSQFGAI